VAGEGTGGGGGGAGSAHAVVVAAPDLGGGGRGQGTGAEVLAWSLRAECPAVAPPPGSGVLDEGTSAGADVADVPRAASSSSSSSSSEACSSVAVDRRSPGAVANGDKWLRAVAGKGAAASEAAASEAANDGVAPPLALRSGAA